jgi:hypothetical protein
MDVEASNPIVQGLNYIFPYNKGEILNSLLEYEEV